MAISSAAAGAKAMSGEKRWTAGLYMRLSRDDEGEGESASIGTQREILRSFAREQGIAVYDEYIDDGWSGTNFQRPAFTRMMEDIRAGRLNCVIAKDLSRLGRNSARGADLLDEIFPSRGVRFISVLDGYDSLQRNCGLALAAPLMMSVHELYARETSAKIRASLRAKMERGEYIGSFAPYGYQKAPDNKNRLVPDGQAGPVVREIFRRAAEGESPGEIAAELNRRGIASPLEYRRTGRLCCGAGAEKRWSAGGVARILGDRVYLGETAQGRREKLSYKSSVTLEKSPEDWVVVRETHEPLTDPACFAAARRYSAARRRAARGGFCNAFSSLAFCAQCGRAMTTAPSRKKGVSHKLCCGGYKAGGAARCSNHFIDYELLCQAVLMALGRELEKEAGAAEALEEALKAETGRKPRDNGAAKARLKELARIEARLYEDMALGRLREEEYDQMRADYEAERQRLEGQAAQEGPEEGIREQILCALRPVALDRGLVSALIARIEVEQGEYVQTEAGREKRQRIHIFWRWGKS